ncbi:MAG: TraU family protein [Thermus sp.]
MVCLIDAITATLGFPLDPLFWCMGTWGGTYPMSKHVSGPQDVEAQAAVTGKLIMKLHRENFLYGSVSEAGLCGRGRHPGGQGRGARVRVARGGSP